jgi:hypothetical protein
LLSDAMIGSKHWHIERTVSGGQTGYLAEKANPGASASRKPKKCARLDADVSMKPYCKKLNFCYNDDEFSSYKNRTCMRLFYIN